MSSLAAGTIGEDGDTINLYYGAADSCMALATGSIRALLGWLDLHCSFQQAQGRFNGNAKLVLAQGLPRVLWLRRECPLCTSVRIPPGRLRSAR